MWNRTFRKNTSFEISSMVDGDVKTTSLKNQKECKEYIYSKCNRGEGYLVTEYYIDKKDKIVIVNQWVYNYIKSGPIFTKNIYSKLKEMKLENAKKNLSLFYEINDYYY